MANWWPQKLSNSLTLIGITIMLLELGWENGCLDILWVALLKISTDIKSTQAFQQNESTITQRNDAFLYADVETSTYLSIC